MATPDERLAVAFITEHPEDAARLLERADPGDAALVLAEVDPDDAARVFRAMGPSAAATCAAKMPDAKLAAMIDVMPLDIASGAMRRVDRSRRELLLEMMSDDHSERLRLALQFPENSAAAAADPLIMTLPDDITVAEAQKQIKGTGSGRHVYYYLYIVKRDGTLVGTVAIPELMEARPKQNLSAVMKTDLVKLDAGTDINTVAAHPAWREFDALPVVDSSGKLVGAIRHQSIRQMQSEGGRPLVSTLVQLSEAYWAGLSGVLASLTPPPAPARQTGGPDNVT